MVDRGKRFSYRFICQQFKPGCCQVKNDMCHQVKDDMYE